jgi:hypothetical protein
MADTVMGIILAVPIGLAFGASVHQAGVSSPQMIRGKCQD